MNTKTVKIETGVKRCGNDYYLYEKQTSISICKIEQITTGVFLITSIYSKRVPYKLVSMKENKLDDICDYDLECIINDVRIEKVEDIFILRLIDTTYEGDFAFYCGESIIIGNLFEIYNKEE